MQLYILGNSNIGLFCSQNSTTYLLPFLSEGSEAGNDLLAVIEKN